MPPWSRIEACHCVADFRRLARRKLPAPIYHYLEGGAEDERAVAGNVAAFDRYRLVPECLRDISAVDVGTRILGAAVAAPVVLSPTGMSRLFHQERELGVARAAEACGVMYSLSTMGTASIEEVAKVKHGPKMFQIYIHRDRGLTAELVERARSAGYDALCLTVDTPLAGNRERDKRSGFVIPPRPSARSFASFALRAGWSLQFLRNSDFRLANIAHRKDVLASGPLGIIAYVNSQFDRGITWDDAAEVISRWNGPFVIKGILSPGDAQRAVDVGASAAMISNHGGRQLDHAIAPIDMLREIRERVGNRLELIIDGGVRRGTDIVKALALGANAVSIGRPYLYALAAGGERGVTRMLRLLTEELERDLALLGCVRLEDLSERHVREIARPPAA